MIIENISWQMMKVTPYKIKGSNYAFNNFIAFFIINLNFFHDIIYMQREI